MAEAAAQTVLDKISQEHLECPICCCRFKDPKILDCLHCFCLKCLEEMMNKNKSEKEKITCPVCRVETLIPDKGLHSLSSCFFLISLVDEINRQEQLLRKVTTGVACESCEEGYNAVSRCLDCRENMCKKCQETHRRIKLLKDHRIIPVHDLDKSRSVPTDLTKTVAPKCRKHIEQPLCFHCETCNTLICSMCAATEHGSAEHHLIGITNAAESFRESVTDVLQKLEKSKEQFASKEDSIKHGLQKKLSQARSDISAKAETEKRKLLTQKVDEIGQEIDSEYEKALMHNREQMKHVDQFVTVINDFMRQADDFGVLELKLAVMHSSEFQKELKFDAEKCNMAFVEARCQDVVSDRDLGEIVLKEKWQLKEELGKESSAERKHGHKVQEEDASVTTGSTSSIMASQTTPETSQDTRVQRSHHLQLVLHEVNTLTEKLTASEQLDSRLQLPYIAVGYFNEKGGELYLDEYGVHLTIPRGAIAPGSPQQVYIYVDPTAPSDDAVDPKELALSSSVECGPEGLKFKESVVLSFPHDADVKSANSEMSRPRMCQDNDSSGRWEEFEGNAVITGDRVILVVNHFTRFKLFGRTRKLEVLSYGDIFDPRQSKYQFRVYVLKDKRVKKNVEKHEEKANILSGFQKLSWGKGDLAVKLSKLPDGCHVLEGATQTISEDQIKTNPSNCVTFTLESSSWPENGVLYCAVETYQDSEDEDKREQSKVRLSICPDKKTLGKGAAVQCVCDPANACSQTGAESSASDETSMTLQEEVRSGFSKRKSSHCAVGDSCDLASNRYSDIYKQVEKLLDTNNDNGESSILSVAPNSNMLMFILKSDEITSCLCQKTVREICRATAEEKKTSRSEVIDDPTLRNLSSKLGLEWESLATYLGFLKPNIDKFKNNSNIDNQIFEMLVKWRDELYVTEQVDRLCEELRNVRKGHIAKKLRDIRDSSLRVVSTELGPDWESLAASLGFEALEIKNTFHGDTTKQSLQMLVEWRDKQLSQKAQIDKLCEELKRVYREDLADEVRDQHPEQPQFLEYSQCVEQDSGNEASGGGSDQPCLKINFSPKDNIEDICEGKGTAAKREQQLADRR